MSSLVNCHPVTEQLNAFSLGLLAVGPSVAVAAHLEYCPQCRITVAEIEKQLASDWLKQEDPHAAIELGPVVESITHQPQFTTSPAVAPVALEECHLEGHSVSLPRVLARAAGNGLVWKKITGGINQARLDLDRQTQCDFMYMKAGSRAPLHTHRGTEITLVLDGRFHDELGQYRPGDFVFRTSKQLHTPTSDDGCLCFSVLDGPLAFRAGLARLLNPFQGVLFNR